MTLLSIVKELINSFFNKFINLFNLYELLLKFVTNSARVMVLYDDGKFLLAISQIMVLK